MTQTRTEVAVRPYRPADRSAVLELLTHAMAGGPIGERTEAFFQWKHERNVFGPSLALVAEDGGAILGFRTFMRWRFRRHGQVVSAVRAVDTATHPLHQGRGIFTTLTRASLEVAMRHGVDMVFNTPNDKSLPGYLKMGWSQVGEVPIAIRVRRPIAFARGARNHRAAAPMAAPPAVDLPGAREVLDDQDAVQGLLDEAGASTHRFHTDRDAAYLLWRYGHAPGLDYRAIAIFDGGRLRGLAIGRPRWRGPLREFTLAEVVVRQGDAGSARRLLTRAAVQGVDHVATHLVGWPTAERVRLRAGYVSVPRLTMTLVARSVDPEVDVRTTLDDWALSLGDLEVF